MDAKIKHEIPSCDECDGQKNGSIFCCLAQEELKTLSSDKRDKHFKKGEIIFYEGNRGHGLYCIYSGKVKIHKLGEEAKEQIVRFAKKGDILGYRSLLSNEPYSATATAIEDCSICFIPKSHFLQALENNHKLSYSTIQLLTNDLKGSEEKLISITQKPVIERVSEALITLKRKFGVKPDGVTLNVVLTRREIGDLAGVTTETTIRTLSDLNKKKVIKLLGKQIQINDLPELTRLAHIVD